MMKNKKGFSFIEIMIFCFISVILLTLVVSMVSNSKEFSRTLGCINNMKTISQAIELFKSDYKETPVFLAELYPKYISSEEAFICPADKSHTNSYEPGYIGRDDSEGNDNKVFLTCNRHQKNSKTVAAYLSYAVDVGKTQKIMWQANDYSEAVPVKFGESRNSGTFIFADNRTMKITDTVFVHSSFTSNDDKIYSIAVIPADSVAQKTHEVHHEGESSRFEVITPAVIAGVEGTKFTISTQTKETNGKPKNFTTIKVSEGIVNVQDRLHARESVLEQGDEIVVSAMEWTEEELQEASGGNSYNFQDLLDWLSKFFVPRKPRR
jgi:competence protein ComGC